MMRMTDNKTPLIAIAVLALAGCHGQEPNQDQAGKNVTARVATVEAALVSDTDAAPGTVVARNSVNVASRLMGYIRSIAVKEGETVKPGQLLFTIDPTDIEGQVRQAKAGAAQADAALADAKTDFERFERLYKDESVPRQTFEKMRLRYHVAQSQAAAAHAGLATAESQLRYAEVRSPIAGVVTRKMASAGDLAAPGRPVVSVEGTAAGGLQVQTSVSSATFGLLKDGEEVTVDIDGGKPLKARISRLVSAADPMSHTHLVKLDLPADAKVTSGAFARVLFPVGSRRSLVVPKDALLKRAGIPGAFVVDDKGIAHYRMVTPGAGSGEAGVEILAGLAAGEKVVVGAPAELDSGDHVVAGQ